MKLKNQLLPVLLALVIGIAGTALITAEFAHEPSEKEGLSLITQTPDEGFQLAVTLSRKGVTTTQPDKEVLFSLRDTYATDPDALIASSQVIAIHFQTIAAANNYWRD